MYKFASKQWYSSLLLHQIIVLQSQSVESVYLESSSQNISSSLSQKHSGSVHYPRFEVWPTFENLSVCHVHMRSVKLCI